MDLFSNEVGNDFIAFGAGVDAIFVHPFGLLEEELIEIDDASFIHIGDFDSSGAVIGEEFGEAIGAAEVFFRVSGEVGFGVDGGRSAEDDFDVFFSANFRDRFQVLFVFRKRDVGALAIDANVVGAKENDDDVGIVIENVLLNALEPLE